MTRRIPPPTSGRPADAQTPPATDPAAGSSSRGTGVSPGASTIADGPPHVPGAAALEPLPKDDRFEIFALVGEGGMGRVYKARDRALGRVVALKLVDAATPAMLARFAQEARAQARLDHPNACRLYEATTIGGVPALAMQFIAGETLLAMAPRLSPRDKLQIVRDVARALHAAHELGIVHRDVKPGNVLVTTGEDGTLHPYVVDFGLAREVHDDGTTQSAASGTPAYMAPEQIHGDLLRIGRRTDVWALGVTLYEIFAGDSPFARGEASSVLLRVLNEEPEPLRRIARDAPRDVETIVHKCLEKEPARRYATAADVADEIDRVLADEPIRAKLGERIFWLRARVRRNRNALTVALFAACAAPLLGYAGLRARASSLEQARVAGDLGASAARLEAIARRSALSPLHDTRQDDREMVAEMDRVRADMDRAPSGAAAGAYALGRAEMSRHDAEAARVWLERAIAAGARGAPVEAALGEALGELYRLAIADAQRVAAALREPALDAAIARYRDPALAHLRRARELGGTSDRVVGLIALDEARYDDAVAAARAAFAADPMAFDAKELEGDAEFQRAGAESNAGHDAAAEASYGRAGDAYGAALGIARSDGALYQKEVRRHAFQIVLATKVGRPAEEHFARAMQMADAAITAEPDSAVARRVRAETVHFMAHNVERSGKDPLALFAAAEASAREALALAPHDPHVRRVLADVLTSFGLAQDSRGKDPSAALEGAIGIYEEVIDEGEGDAWYGNGLGLARRSLAAYRAEQGIEPDPRAGLEAAAEAYESAIAMNPDWSAPRTSLCDTLRALAEEYERRGDDPSAILDRAADAADAALALEPGSAAATNNRGLIDVRRGIVMTTRGEDGTALFDAALARFENAHRVAPKYALAVQNAGNTFLARADDDRVHRRDPSTSVRAAVEAFARRAVMDPSSYWAQYQAALAWRVAVYDALAHGRDASAALRAATTAQLEALQRKPNDVNARALGAELALLLARTRGPIDAADLRRARSEVDAVLARSPHDAGALRIAADIARELAAQAVARGEEAKDALASAEQACARADAVLPGNASVEAIRGAGRLLEARAHIVAHPEDARSAAKAAVADLDDALARDARLVPDYESLRTEAARLAK